MRTLILFFKAEQFGLFDAPVQVSGHSTKRGTFVAPYSATRKKRLQQDSGPTGDLFAGPAQPEAPKGAYRTPDEWGNAWKKFGDFQQQQKQETKAEPSEPEAKAAQKEPWALPKDKFGYVEPEYLFGKQVVRGPAVKMLMDEKDNPYFHTEQAAQKWIDKTHKRLVKEAIAAGKPVPAEVLADYPNLKPKAAEPAKPEDTEVKSKATAINLVQMERAHLTGKAPEALPWDEADIEVVKKLLKYRKEDRKDLVKIYERQLRADPRKFSPGDAVSWLAVKGQINRGYRVLQVSPNSKLAVIQPYRDTGLADFEYEGYKKQTVHVGNLQHEGGRAKPEKNLNAWQQKKAAIAAQKEQPPVESENLSKDELIDRIMAAFVESEKQRDPDLVERKSSGGEVYWRNHWVIDNADHYGSQAFKTKEELERFNKAKKEKDYNEFKDSIKSKRESELKSSLEFWQEQADRASGKAIANPKPAPVRGSAPKSSSSGQKMVEHTTKQGKVIRGTVRLDLSLKDAKLLDPYTFKKDGGYFIREKYLKSHRPLVLFFKANPTAGVV